SHGGSVAFGPRGLLAVGSIQDEKAQVWIADLASGRVLRSFAVGDRMIPNLTWARDGTLFTWQRPTGRSNGLPVRRWSADTGQRLADLSPYRELKLSPDGRFAALDAGNEVRLVDLARNAKVRLWKGATLANLGFGKQALYFYRGQAIVQVDLGTLQEKEWRRGGFAWVLPSGLLACVCEEHGESQRDYRVWMEFFDFGAPSPRQTLPTSPGVASPDGRWYASDDGVWDLVGGERVEPLSGYGAMAFSPDSRRLIYSSEKSVLLLDLEARTRRTLATGGAPSVAGTR
ncbi:MAG TPA: hypothetical protein VNO81_08405, partial [Candidatus Nitrosotenuis sp.]|nr:hypothetical protein [Candidatus Nitrosotenuis sp.]